MAPETNDVAETLRLYYDDPYLREFTARVVGRAVLQGRPAVMLDRTAFYPTGGGQPNDKGRLNDVLVIDTLLLEGGVWHILDGVLPNDQVTGVLDWGRRFDHMQQHTGQHVLSQALLRLLDAETVSFHLGEHASTIDLAGVHQDPVLLRQVEEAANRLVDDAVRVTVAFHDDSSLTSVPLRKPPKVSERIRVVEVEGYDWSACGGTHLRNCAEIGLIKIVGAERRAGETRISFLCGGRAREDYARLQSTMQRLAATFSTSQAELPAAIDRLVDEEKALRHALGAMEAAWVESTAESLAVGAGRMGPANGISAIVDWPLDRAKRVAQALRARPGLIILLGIAGDRPQLIFTRSDEVEVDMGAVLKVAANAAAGRGGGRPDWAQGGVPASDGLRLALQVAADTLNQ